MLKRNPATVKAGALSLYGTRGAFDLSLAHKYRSSRLLLCFASLLLSPK